MAEILSRDQVAWVKGDFQPVLRGGPIRTSANPYAVLALIDTIEALHDALVLSERARHDHSNSGRTQAVIAADAAVVFLREKGWMKDE